MDKIFITGLSTECVVGVWDWERQIKQPVVVDLEIATDVRKAASTDRIEDALIDYKKVAQRVQEFIEASQFQLIETLTERIAELIIGEFGAPWVKVRLNKQGTLGGSKDVGTLIERSKADAAT